MKIVGATDMKIVGATGFRGLWALNWAWQTFFLGQTIGIDVNNTLQLKLTNTFQLKFVF